MGKTVIDYEAIDPNCREIVRTLNEYPGITTIGSCQGHYGRKFFVSFKAQSLDDLETVTKAFEENWEFRLRWIIEANYTDGLWFSLSGPREANPKGIIQCLKECLQKDREG